MTARKIKVKKEDRSKSSRYLKKAEDNYNQMIEALNNDNYNAAATLAIQVALSAADAVCIHEKNIRSISENHSDLCDLVKSLPLAEAKNKSLVLKRIISKKNLVQYESRRMYKAEAKQIVKGATRFYQWVDAIIG